MVGRRCIGDEILGGAMPPHRLRGLIPLQFAEGEVRGRVKERLSAIFRTRTAEEWFEALRPFDCCVTPVRTIVEVSREIPDANGAMPVPDLGAAYATILGARRPK